MLRFNQIVIYLIRMFDQRCACLNEKITHMPTNLNLSNKQVIIMEYHSYYFADAINLVAIK